MKIWSLILAAALAVAGVNAEAKRLGGGKSVGKQSSNVTQKEASPGAPGGAAQSAAKPAAPAAAAPAVAPKRPWGAMLGGLAAGLGLAWLAHSLGMGEAFGNILMFGLLALGVMMAIGWFMRKRAGQGQGAAPNRTPFAFEGAGAGSGANSGAANTPISAPAQYSPANVGNDASARPWERSAAAPLEAARPAGGSLIGSALTPAQGWSVPADFDSAGFLSAAKANFVSLQAAWDKSDISALRAMMTDEMLEEIKTQLADREGHTGGPSNHTEVVMIEASLLGIEDLGQGYMASVEFSGMIKEDPASGPNPFREVWNMTRTKSGNGGWLVAGVQALQ
jgi:predicted lipid-binding transport protein (Tim44 family)